jgi:hypothetical protein
MPDLLGQQEALPDGLALGFLLGKGADQGVTHWWLAQKSGGQRGQETGKGPDHESTCRRSPYPES